MSSEQSTQALEILNDTNRPSLERETAVKQLASNPTPAVIDRLINALEDDDSSVRWTAASMLIEIGDPVLRPLLRCLVDKEDSTWLREGAYRVFHDTRSRRVQESTSEVVKALKGLGSGVSTTEAAYKALMTLDA